jgi:cytochrome c551/c552
MSEEITSQLNPRGRKVRYLIAAVFLLAIAVCWGFWSEGSSLRTRNEYQAEFARRFNAYLDRVEVRSADAQKKINDDPQYQKLYQRYTQLSEQAEGQAKEIRPKLDQVNKELAPVIKIFREFQNPSGQPINYGEMEKKYISLKQQKDGLTAQLDALMKPSKEALDAVNAFTAARTTELPPDKLDQLKRRYENGNATPNEVQLSVPAAKNGDKCQTCHIGVSLTGLELTPASMSLPDQQPDKYARAFVTHPKPELLQIHDPAKFGCTLCHGGNGRETASVERAHGTYAAWSKPLYPKGYTEIGCQTCHASDTTLAGRTDLAPVLNQAKAMYRQGCIGCHRLAGFEDEREDLKSVANQIRMLEEQKENNLRQAALKERHAEVAVTDETARGLLQEAKNLNTENNRIDVELAQLNQRTRDLLREQKKVGHDFKEMRNKLYPNWVPFFVHGPGRPLGPTTPKDEDIRAMAAYLWQTAIPDPIPKQQPGDAVKGKELLETRGCLGCHPISANPPSAPGKPAPRNGSGPVPASTLSLIGDPPLIGTTFAIPLSRAGERDKYDYLVRWIYNPQQRIRPYCLLEKRDIGPEDYAKHGLPYIFDQDHDRCPNDGQLLQVQQPTVMPNLRLPLDEARDIASYLVTLKKKEPTSFPDAALDDPKLKEKGKALIEHNGCAACHEIAGFEMQEPIGSDLTYIGSKSVEQLDFGPLRKMAQQGTGEPISYFEDRERLPGGPANGPWYSLKDFIEHKLAEPNVFDLGTTKSDMELLRMPNTRLTADQVRALTVLLLGSQKTDLPPDYIYRPDTAGADIQSGWRVVRKYNCMGCHQILPGQQTPLMNLPVYRDHAEQLPPTLVMVGAKVNPEWLARYLKNPALSDSDTHRNGVRQYLKIRMPTFSFSDNEIRILVQFFQALAHQPTIYIPAPVSVTTAKETETARKLWSNPELSCLTCHSSGDPVREKYAIAPNFLLARDRLNPGWLERWMIEPHEISPGCVMPSGFLENNHLVMDPHTPPATVGTKEDLAKLLVRYMFQLTPPEQRRLMGTRLAQVRQQPQRQSAYHPTGSAGR